MPLRIGDKLGHYEIVDVLGKGGMGEVYRAHDARVKRDVAVKTSNTQFSERFQREAEAIAGLSHPNICTLFDVGPNYLVMELVEGPTLAETIKRGALPVPEALRIAGQIADALEAAHAKPLVHRDLKPANVKVRPDGLVKVLDFGLAKTGASRTPGASAEDSPTLTMGLTDAGMILGTAGYMSPEQARGEVVDHRADIWAFGVLLYEMLCGTRLYSGATVSDTLAAVLLKEPDWSRVPVPELSSVGRLLRWCLEKDPKKRLSDIAMARRMLVEDPAPVTERLSASLRSRFSGVAMVAGAVLVAVTGALAWVHFTEQPPPAQTTVFQMQPSPGTRGAGRPEVSPDGRKIAFLARNSSNRISLWIRTVDSLEARQLSTAGESVVFAPFWSPDGKWVAYAAEQQLKKVEVAGGVPQILCSLPGIFRGGSWSPNGTILFSNYTSGGTENGLWKVSSAGGAATQILSSRTAFQTYPAFLPDGTHFLWTSAPTLAGGDVLVGSLDTPSDQWPKERLATTTGKASYLPPRGGSPGLLLFPRDNGLMAQEFDAAARTVSGDVFRVVDSVRSVELQSDYGVSPSGALVYRGGGAEARALTWLDRTGKVTGSLGDPAQYSELNLSPDGKQVAVVKGGDIWLLDLDRNTSIRFTSDEAEDKSPVWSPDGSRIVFASNRSGHFDLYEKRSNNTTPEQVLLATPQNKEPSSWSPDGQWLVFTNAQAPTNMDILLLSTATKEIKPFAQGRANEGQGNISPDGRWMAYVSLESGRAVQSYLRSFPSGDNQLAVTENGSAEPRWRGDSRELFVRAQAENSILGVEVTAEGGAPRLGLPKPVFAAPLLGAGGFNQNPNWIVSRDGQRFLAVLEAEDTQATPLTVVLNWQPAAKK